MVQSNPWLISISELEQSYRGTYHSLKKAKERSEDVRTIQMITQMISDVDFAIEWMHTGRRPGNKRGIERRSAYQREKLMDPIRMQAYAQQNHAGSPSNLTDGQRNQLEMALSRLSERERECYVMAHGHCHSMSDIAAMLNIRKSSVQTFVERAQNKISKDLQMNLFLLVE
ncbi:sigma factor-like helix-turn-helix DNA-binding protein [Paenibacillus sp. N3.4]|uniref:sigma factor-like helix-turn-helix DNA-binding protein n=1 Tax=Paenibacillus sp. N3.4 TaxID=2603222 RepID=UPI0011CC17E6|nr:sigma factor-like helix-turn-helix DNA-binding protein [Paenibacillus sp. N3.4]TXK82615.1 RNA polymerase subunit sigma-24 [Paenibacillus sp. N3.4]